MPLEGLYRRDIGNCFVIIILRVPRTRSFCKFQAGGAIPLHLKIRWTVSKYTRIVVTLMASILPSLVTEYIKCTEEEGVGIFQNWSIMYEQGISADEKMRSLR
jgi:hypothetical protein